MIGRQWFHRTRAHWDIDIVVDVVILEDTDAYSTLEENLRRIGFKSAVNGKGQNLNWRWWVKIDDGSTFELGESEDRENRIIRQRRVADTMEAFLGAIGGAEDE